MKTEGLGAEHAETLGVASHSRGRNRFLSNRDGSEQPIGWPSSVLLQNCAIDHRAPNLRLFATGAMRFSTNPHLESRASYRLKKVDSGLGQVVLALVGNLRPSHMI